MSDEWTDRLSEYLDDELPPGSGRRWRRTWHECAECAAALADLRRVVARARGPRGHRTREPISGPASPPGSARHPRAPGGSLGSPGARALDLLPAAAARGGDRPDGPLRRHGVAAAPGLRTAAARSRAAPRPRRRRAGWRAPVSWQRRAAPGYDAAVADLERVLARGPRTPRHHHGAGDRAEPCVSSTRPSRRPSRAVAADSANAYLNSHLAETMRRKLDLLRQAASLVSAVS